MRQDIYQDIYDDVSIDDVSIDDVPASVTVEDSQSALEDEEVEAKAHAAF